ncbi:hypothetical protein [Hyalangium rubrum]|uniref:Uncharacterized protein n=1 Tax=Hyalangium rubrum TaxID=3103134 RepID=A0ABU5HGS7_9BACT|nr:hypothetical protein [Hyalangium sp. s54d21]MDY7232441.1 hypothetical protein [Hyalangium sp. s54d21]
MSMFGSEILDVAIGLILVYLLLSLICSAVREALEGWMKSRAIHLELGIRELLHDLKGEGLAQSLYKHPLIFSLYQGGYDEKQIDPKRQRMPGRSQLPSYIPASNFALALMDIVARGSDMANVAHADASAPTISLERLRTSVGEIKNAAVQRALLIAIDTANGSLAQAQKNIEGWFNSSMDRVSGWYKRRTQAILFILGLGITIALNVNSLTLIDYLSKDDAIRKAVVAEAEARARGESQPKLPMRERYTELQNLGLPIGWEAGWPGPQREVLEGKKLERFSAGWLWAYVFQPIFGWLCTAFAIMLGAPFWFDLLNKFMVIRSTVKPHEKSPEEGSEDRQKPAPK